MSKHTGAQHVPWRQTIDILDLHLQELSQRELLTAAEEQRLARLMQPMTSAGTMEADKTPPAQLERARQARETLITHNLRLVVSIAKQYRHQGLAFADLIQEGSVGLMTAVDKFDPLRGTRLSTYATPWIHQSIRRALANHSRLIRLPVNWHNNLGKLRAVRQELEQHYGREPSLAELAARSDLSEVKIERLLQANQAVTSLEKPIFEEDAEFGDTLQDESAPLLDEQMILESQIEELHLLLAELPAREAKILRLRYGLDDAQIQTNRAIGERIGLSKERVRQIEQELRARMRRRLLETND